MPRISEAAVKVKLDELRRCDCKLHICTAQLQNSLYSITKS